MALNWNFKKQEYEGTAWIHLAKDMGQATGLCEHDKEHIDTVNGADFPRSSERPSPSKKTKLLHVVILSFTVVLGA